MPVRTHCPACHKDFQFPDWYLGRTVPCPNCDGAMRIQPRTAAKPATGAAKPAGRQPQVVKPPPPSGSRTKTVRVVTPPPPSETETMPGIAAPAPKPAAPQTTVSTAETTGELPADKEEPVKAKDLVANTNVSLFTSGLVGVVLTAVFYIAVVLPLHFTYVGELFADRGIVPYVIMLVSFWSAAILVMKYRKISRQRRILYVDVLPLELDEEIMPDNVILFRQHIRGIRQKHSSSFLVNRIQRALALFGSRGSVQEVAGYLTAQAEIDATAVQTSYKMVKVFIWAIPILGFIGTVLGIGRAVGGFSGAIESAQDLDLIKGALGTVTSGLALAFDTTLVALIMSIVVMLPASSLQKSEEDLLNTIDEFCNENLLRRLNESRMSEEADNEPIVAAVRAGLEEMRSDFRESMGKFADVGNTVTKEMAETWDAVRQRIQKDNLKIIEQMQDMLRSTSAERRAFVDQVKSVQQEQTRQFESMIRQTGESAKQMHDKIAALQKGQVVSYRDVVSNLAGELQGIQKQAAEQNQAHANALQATAGEVATTLASIQQRSEKLPDTIARQLNTTMGSVRVQLSKVGAETANVFREQTNPLKELQASVEGSVERFAAHLEKVRPVHAQAVTDIRDALTESVKQTQDRVAEQVREPVLQLQQLSNRMCERLHAVEQEAADSRKAVQDAAQQAAEGLAQATQQFRQASGGWQDVTTASTEKMLQAFSQNLQKIHQHVTVAESKVVAEHQKSMSEVGRKMQLVANMSAERQEKAAKAEKNLVDALNRTQKQLAEQFRGLTQLLKGQDVLVQTQSVLAGNLQALESSQQLQTSLAGLTTFLEQLTPVLTNLTEQVDRLAAAREAGDGRPKKRGWFG